MAKVLVLRLQSIIGENLNNLTCFYDSLEAELKKQGNEILWINTIQEAYIKKGDKKSLKKWIASWIDKIKEFNPDIIFTFNNRIFEEVINVTNCPIVLFEADLVDYFVNNELIKKYNERYYLAAFTGDKYIEEYQKLGFKKERIINLHPATSVIREDREKINNISFIGSAFMPPSVNLMNKIIQHKDAYKMYQDFWENGNYDYQKLCKEYLDEDIKITECYKVFDSRLYILQSLLDLGLKLYGVGFDKLTSPQLLPLVAAFDKTQVYSLQHNQDVYNSSIVNLSISHPQCQGYAFPWRIYDIMASSGVLVSSYSEQLANYTKDFVQIPMYNSPYEARDLVKKLLTEENLRCDIIAASNEFIDKYGRWTDNLEKISASAKVKLCGNDINSAKSSPLKYELNDLRFNYNFKNSFKSMAYGVFYVLSFLPIIYSEKSGEKRKKLYREILKYNPEFRKYAKENYR